MTIFESMLGERQLLERNMNCIVLL